MPEFTAILVSADGQRTHKVRGLDYAAASGMIANIESLLGAESQWFLAAIVQTDHLELVAATLSDVAI